MNPLVPIASTVAAAVGAAARATFVPRSRLWGQLIHRGPAIGNRIALTFDDGPTPGATDAILNTLKDLRVPATFFVIGANAERYPELLRRIHDEGHLLANHSFHHAHFALFHGPHYWRDELSQTSTIIQQITGRDVRFFRPPMGIKTPIILRQATRHHLRTIAWSHRAHDGFATTPEKITQRLTADVTPGSVLLIHDGVEPNHPHRDPSASIAAVRPVVETLRSRGLEFSRLDDLLDPRDLLAHRG